MKCADEIMLLLAEEPHTNEALRRALAKKGFYASNDTVRKVCMAACGRGEVKKTSVVTKQHRNGIAIWSRVDESPEKIQACVDMLKSLKGSDFRFAR